jgi:SAM-dependent methyltransferase
VLTAYARLAQYYDAGEWGAVSLEYLGHVANLGPLLGARPSRILDVSCGTGTLVGELAKSAYAVGSDLSAAMIAEARKKYPGLAFHVADMAELQLAERFDLIVSPFDSINYLTEPGALGKALANVASLLEPRGCVLFDFNTPHLYEARHRGTHVRRVGGVELTQICRYDRATRSVETRFDFGPDGCEQHRQRAFDFAEVGAALTSSGLVVAHAKDLETGAEVRAGSLKILVAARRAG